MVRTNFSTAAVEKNKMPISNKRHQPQPPTKKAEEVLFLVNRNGFPIDCDTWERMWQFATLQYPDKKEMIYSVRHSHNLPQVPAPSAPTLSSLTNVNVWEYTMAVQDYLEKLQYNHTGTQFFEINKSRSLTGLMDTAKSMIQESLPIKCLESVILAIYLTNGLTNMERFTVNFKSKFCGRSYYHVVLGVYYMGVYGTLGMSRRSDLMYKPLLHKTLSELVFDFVECYRRYQHRVVKVTIGNYVPHHPRPTETVVWKGLSLHLNNITEDHARKEIDKYARQMKHICGSGAGPLLLPPQGLINLLSRPSPHKFESSDDEFSTPAMHSTLQDSNSSFHPYKLRI